MKDALDRGTLSFAETCARIGTSRRTGERWLHDGTFPVPALPRLGRRHRFAIVEIERYLANASTQDVAPRRYPRPLSRKVIA